MTLSGGLYAHAFNRKQPPGKKHWPPLNPEKKYINRCFNELAYLTAEQNLRLWLITGKQYGAEYENCPGPPTT